MKKILFELLTIIFAITLCLGVFTACDNNSGDDTPAHTHYYTTIKSNELNHWHECTCGEKQGTEAHKGGTATETSKAICEVCGKEYGLPLTHVHNYNTLKNDGTNHWHECTCGEKQGIEAHKGGTATETSKAICLVCNQEYGSILEHSHTFTEQVVQNKYLKEQVKCESKAQYYYTCKCGEIGTTWFEYGENLDHSYTNYIYNNDAKCEQDGTETAVCNNGCGESDTRTKTGTALNHKFVNYASNNDATCTKNGTKTAKCENKPCTKTDTIDDLGTATNVHSYGEDGCCTICKTAFNNQPTEGVIYFVPSGKNYAVVLGYEGTSKRVVIADTYNNLPVKEIGEEAFYQSNITHIVIPEGVEIIADSAFQQCANLISVSLPNSITSIGSSAFANCSNLEIVNLPKQLIHVGYIAFRYTKTYYNNNNWVDNVLYIDDWVVDSNASILGFCSIKDGTIGVCDSAFFGCKKLTSVVIPKSVISICEGAFLSCTNLTAIYYTGDKDDWDKIQIVLSNTNLQNATRYYYVENKNCKPNVCGKYWYYDCGEIVLWEYHDYESVVTLPTCEGLGYTTYTCHCGDSYIDNYVNALGHTEVIDNAVAPTCTETGLTQGKHCSVCDKVLVAQEVVEPLVHDYVDYFCTMCGAEYCTAGLLFEASSSSNPNQIIVSNYDGKDTEVYIPSIFNGLPVTSIGEDAFSDCSSLTSITIPDSVTSIGSYAFYNCSSLTSIEIPNGVTNICDRVFYNCNSLQNIKLSNSITSVGNWAFENCYSLESIIIPNSVTSIASYAFRGCRMLTSIGMPDSVTSISVDAFHNTGIYNNEVNWQNGVLYIGNYLIKAKSTTTSSIAIKDGTKLVAASAFYNCDSLTSITIPNSVTNISNRMFYGCDSLMSVTIGNGVTSIGAYAFYDCDLLMSITIGNGVTIIGDYAFKYCSSLTNVNYLGTIDEWVQIEFVDKYANPLVHGAKLYMNDKLVTEASIINATKINDYAFYNCASLISVIIGDNVISIGAYALSNCDSLTNVIIGNSVRSIDDYAFSNCDSLTTLKYRGTALEFYAIDKGKWWNIDTIICNYTGN